MKLPELQQALRAADPAAVLVAPRVLERVIQQVCKLPNFIWRIPHRSCYVVDRHVLFRHVDQDDLDLEPDQLLPPTVILLARPPATGSTRKIRAPCCCATGTAVSCDHSPRAGKSLEGRHADPRRHP